MTSVDKKKYIGIDPGKNTGIAVWYNKKYSYVGTLDFWRAYYFVIIYNPDNVEIFIEVPRTKYNWHKSKHGTTSANVGGIYREACLLSDGLEKKGFTVNRIHPQGKKTAAQVQRITGYTKPTNEHTRDAMMLVYGR